MTLRLQINLLLGAVIALFIIALLATEMAETRAGVREEIIAANRVAQQLIGELAQQQGAIGVAAVQALLQRVGRVRSTEITLIDADGEVLYRSPPATYKAGRDAPRWYAQLMEPAPILGQIRVADGQLIMQSNASRAILDGWDNMVELARVGLIALVLGLALVFWLTRRATEPFRRIAAGLLQMQRGDYRTRLPAFGTQEARDIAHAFNAAASAIQDNLNARQQAVAAQLQAEYNANLADAIQDQLEQQRRQIARELHDETSQSLTAIRTLALALGQRDLPPQAQPLTQMIEKTAAGLHDAIHRLIPRLDVPLLDRLELAEALEQRLADWRTSHPKVRIQIQVDVPPQLLGPHYALAAYRITQEAVTNAYRHAGATRIDVQISTDAQGVHIVVQDNGRGLPANWQRPGHYGLRWMRERAQALGGTLQLQNRAEGGLRLDATLPWS